MTALLDAVDALTKPQRRKQGQDILENGKVIGQQKVTVEVEPLLTQLDEAIRSDIGSTAAGASLAHERSILDGDALHKFMQIASQVKDWCRIVKVTPTGDPVKDLQAWHMATLERGLSDESEAFYVRTLGKWAGLIEAKLDPWRERDLPDACPICEATEWWRDGAKYYRPLVVRYKPDGADLIQQARGLCRACEATWTVRELAYEIEARHAAAGGPAAG